ncbi:PAS domain S-box protein [candidate division KSB1 bacterium]|nr:PAS domain S-box protein [candidate division KSB1 bacterium]
MQKLKTLILDSEDWLIDRIMIYAKQQDYTKYTSTLKEAWRMSICGLSRSFCCVLDQPSFCVEFGPDDNFRDDPIAEFGVVEAQKHRSRGITPGMFLGLMKYYKQAYVDLIESSGFSQKLQTKYRYLIERFFDRVEIACCTEWTTCNETEKVRELQESNRIITNLKNKYLTIFESMYVPVILINDDNRIDSINHAAMKMFWGNDRPGADDYDQLNDNRVPRFFIDLITDFLKCNTLEMNVQKRLPSSLGERLFLVKMKKMLDISEKFRVCVIMLYDIQDEHEAKLKLKLEREQFISVFDSMRQLVYVIDPKNYEILFMNQYFKELLGGDRTGEICYHAFQDYQIPCNFCTTEILEKLNGESYEWEYYNRVLKKHLLVIDRVIRWPDGRNVRLEFAVDMTDRIQAQVLERKFTLAVEQSPNSIVITDIDGKIEYVNRKFSEITGYTPEEVKGKNPRILKSGQVESTVYSDLWNTILSGKEWKGELLNKNKNGDLFWEIVSISPIIDTNGVISHFISTQENITEIKNKNDKLKALNEQLQRSNEDLEQFTYAVSHDLKEPLRKVISYSDFILEDYRNKFDETGKRYLQRVQLAAYRMRQLIDDLLEISRVTSRESDYQEIDIFQVVKKLLEDMEFHREQKDTYLDSDGNVVRFIESGKTRLAWADTKQIRQVYQNLISNALKYQQKGATAIIEIGSYENGSRNTFFVKDNGIGIDKKYFKKVFELFQRLHTREEYSGTGVGLTLCKRIIQKHGGSIWCESDKGSGTTFYFTLKKSANSD